MPTSVLVRHGRTSANEQGILAGRSPGVTLDEVGQSQATTLATRLSTVPFATIVTSPLERTRETAAHIHAQQGQNASEVVVDERFIECDYGTWTGQSLATLAKESLWKQVQSHPSAVTFPDGESLMAMGMRAVAAIREWISSRVTPTSWRSSATVTSSRRCSRMRSVCTLMPSSG